MKRFTTDNVQPMGNKAVGFSLLELLVYIAVLSVVMVVIVGTFLPINRGRGKSQARAATNSTAIFILERIQRDLLAATAVLTPSATASASSTLVIQTGGLQVTYDVSDGVVRRRVGTGAPATLSPPNVSIGTLSFTKLENVNSILGKTRTSVFIRLTVMYNSSSPDFRYTAVRQSAILLWH